MKTKIIIILSLLIAISVVARIIPPFQSWGQLQNWSSSIVIVVAGYPAQPTPAYWHGSPTESDFGVTVFSVLKGTNSVRTARLQTDHELKTGQAYLVFSDSYDDGIYKAWEDYRVLPLGSFKKEMIEGKPLDKQLQILFKLAVDNLNSEIAQKETERDRIKSGLKDN